MNKSIESSKAPEPVGLYPHARRVGNLLFLSGVGPRERGTKKIPGVELNEQGKIVSYDIEAQCHSVFRNIKYILEDSGRCASFFNQHER
jgi:2-aminomuconate deaminase